MHTCRGSGHREAPLATSCTLARALSLSFFLSFSKTVFCFFKFCTFLKSIYNCWFCAERAHLRLLRGGDGLGCLFGLEKGGCGRSARRAGERRCLWRSAEADRIRWLPSPLPCTGLKTTSDANHERSKSQQY